MKFTEPPHNLPVVEHEPLVPDDDTPTMSRLLAHAVRCGCVPELDDRALKSMNISAPVGIDSTELRPLIEDMLRFLAVLLRLTAGKHKKESPPTP